MIYELTINSDQSVFITTLAPCFILIDRLDIFEGAGLRYNILYLKVFIILFIQSYKNTTVTKPLQIKNKLLTQT